MSNIIPFSKLPSISTTTRRVSIIACLRVSRPVIAPRRLSSSALKSTRLLRAQKAQAQPLGTVQKSLSSQTASPSLLSYFRSRSQVDADTLSLPVVQELGPFVDATSNQAIAYLELAHVQHADVLEQAAKQAEQMFEKYMRDTLLNALGVEIATITLALRLLPHLTGNLHIQVNPFMAYSTPQTVAASQRIISLAKILDPDVDASRISIKIPSTWEGLMACRELEEKGIKTLATTLFTIEQAKLARDVDCSYIAPYVNQLKVHFEPGFQDPSPNLSLSVQAQRVYEIYGKPTMVLPASLTSISECLALAGVDHITISPPLLKELASTTCSPSSNGRLEDYPSLFDTNAALEDEALEEHDWLGSEANWRMILTRSAEGRNEAKLIEAINIFCGFQVKLEEMIERRMN